jgi:hypothetical protein
MMLIKFVLILTGHFHKVGWMYDGMEGRNSGMDGWLDGNVMECIDGWIVGCMDGF